jgi:hypothetical protein
MASRRSLRCCAVWAAVSVGAAAALGCGSPGRKFPARPSLLEPVEQGASVGAAGAEWRYHPRKPARLERAYPLPEGRSLLLGGGERWLMDGKRSWPASMLAPEPLIGALTSKRSAWVFVGRSGTTYDADSPTGALGASSAPLAEMARVDSGQNDVLGVSREGELWLSDDAGLGWRQVGPAGVEFEDVLVEPPHAIALAVPERLWHSNDEGHTWQALDQPPFGARALARDDEAGSVAVSVLGIRSFAFGADVQLSPLQRQLKPAEPSLAGPPVQWPSAKAIARGRAYDKSGRYFELLLGAKAETLSGPSAGELERRPAPLFSSCNDARVAGFERWVYVACTRERSGSSQRFEFFRSENAGASFEREAYGARGDPELLELAVGAEGVLLVTGLCTPSENVPGCRPQGIYRRAESDADAGAGPLQLLPVAAPALEEHARGLAFSSDGRTAYAVGPRTKSDALFAFVSTELARGFSARPIEALDDSESRGQSELVQLTASAEGQLSLVLVQPSGAERLVVLDAAARTVSFNSAPVDAAVIGAYGNRALAVSPENVWESLNGGAEWDNLGRLPRSICAAASGRCSLAIHCGAEGCTLGDNLSRVGWRGREAPSALLPPPSAARPGVSARRSLAPPWSCDLSNGEWTELRGVERLPDAGQAAIGKAAWFALSTDDATAAAGLYVAEAGRASRDVEVRYSELLGPAARPSEQAYQASLQVEGAAALRFRVPTAAAAPLTDIEVAWDNLLEGQHRRAVIPDAGAALPGDFVRGDGPARRAQPDLVSIASGGIFVRVHRQPQQDQVSYFLNGTGVEAWPALRWGLLPPKDTSFEMVRLSGESVHLAFVDQGATIVRARRRGNAWQLDAMSVGYADAGNFSIEQHRDIAYVRGHAGIHLTTHHADGATRSELFPLQLEGPVLAAPSAVPTQRDLGDALVPCNLQQRAETPRIVAPHHAGRRRPLVVRDAVEPVRIMLTDAAVLHGTAQSPCADAFDADLVRAAPGGSTRERALLSLDGPSWLFRLAPDNSRRETRVEYRSMNCRPDAGVELPAEIYDMPGTNQND